jgi:hypothetical protein
MKKNKYLVFFCICLFSFCAFSQHRILFMKGRVLVNGKKAVNKQILKQGDKVLVGKKSLALLQIKGNGVTSKLKLDEESAIVLEKLPTKSNLKSSILLQAGSLFTKVQNKYKKDKVFQVRTRNTVMGVRGTEFFSAYGQGKDFWMCVNEGKVTISNKKGSKSVNAGEGVFVEGGSSITKPKPYAWTRKLNWSMSGNFKSLKNKVDLSSVYSDLLDQDYD